MSSDEQDAAILRVVKGRAESKQRKLLLESELRAAGESLYHVGSALRYVGHAKSVQEAPGAILQRLAMAPEICELERVKAMLTELKEATEKLKQLDITAQELGIG
jgi:hypothetical protein